MGNVEVSNQGRRAGNLVAGGGALRYAPRVCIVKSALLTTGIIRLGFILVAVCASPTLARAEATAQERALSESLFVEGKKLLDEGHAAEACPKLAESQRLDPGGGTQLLLGLCWEQAGRLATAWLELKDALAVALRDGRESRIQVAREHLAAIEPRLSKIEFRISAEANVEGLVIRRNGTEIPRAAWSVAMPFDAGDHEFGLSAPGYESATVSAHVEGEGQIVPLPIPVLKKAQVAEPAPLVGGKQDTKPADPQQPTGAEDSTSPSLTRPIIGWALVGGGAIVAGLGSYFGVRAMSLSKETKEQCPETVCNIPELEDDYDKAGTAAKNANIAFISAGVLVTAGVVTLLTGRPPKQTASEKRRTQFAVSPAREGAQLHLMGEF